MARVLRRPQAHNDIDDIWNYIADDSIHAADNWLDKLDEQFALLTLQPLMGRARDELAAGIRSFPLGRYVIFYLPLPNGIDVVRILIKVNWRQISIYCDLLVDSPYAVCMSSF